MKNQENKMNTIQTAEQTLKAGNKFSSRICPKEEGDLHNDDKGVVRLAMAWHFRFALRLFECLFMLRGSHLGSPAGVLFRTFSEIVTRGVWIAHSESPAIRVARARSYSDYSAMKHEELQRRMDFLQSFFVSNKRSEETIRAGLKEYREKGTSKSDPQIRKAIARKYGENSCTIAYGKMLKDIDLEGEYETVYPIASAATHGIPTKFDVPGVDQQSLVADYISTATDRFYVLAHHTAVVFGIKEEEFNLVFRAAIQAREKKTKGGE